MTVFIVDERHCVDLVQWNDRVRRFSVDIVSSDRLYSHSA